MLRSVMIVTAFVLAIGGCASGPVTTLREVFPGVRVDAAAKTVEFDAEVPIDCHNAKTPRVYLEVIACTPNSKEHETLVVTKALPSNIHAALLLCGLEPGKAGSWTWDGKVMTTHPPTGAEVNVTFTWRDSSGKTRSAPALDWVSDSDGKRRPGGSFVFAGSRIVNWQGQDYYDADGTGTLIGLTTFGSETVALTEVHSPESEVEEPEWIADRSIVPERKTPVVVRISGR